MHSLTSDGRRYQLRVELVDASGKHFYQVDITVDGNTHHDILIMFQGLSVHIHVIRVHTTKKEKTNYRKFSFLSTTRPDLDESR